MLCSYEVNKMVFLSSTKLWTFRVFKSIALWWCRWKVKAQNAEGSKWEGGMASKKGRQPGLASGEQWDWGVKETNSPHRGGGPSPQAPWVPISVHCPSPGSFWTSQKLSSRPQFLHLQTQVAMPPWRVVGYEKIHLHKAQVQAPAMGRLGFLKQRLGWVSELGLHQTFEAQAGLPGSSLCIHPLLCGCWRMSACHNTPSDTPRQRTLSSLLTKPDTQAPSHQALLQLQASSPTVHATLCLHALPSPE